MGRCARLLFAQNSILDCCRILYLLIRMSFTCVLLLWNYGLHVAEFFLESGQHLLGDLKLHCAWMMLNSQGIGAQVLNQRVVLPLIIVLAHLKHHIFITP